MAPFGVVVGILHYQHIDNRLLDLAVVATAFVAAQMSWLAIERWIDNTRIAAGWLLVWSPNTRTATSTAFALASAAVLASTTPESRNVTSGTGTSACFVYNA
jgi:hypothetical protein